MTIADLIEQLQGMVDDDLLPDHTPVVVAHQPKWPLRLRIDALTVVQGNEPGDVEVYIATDGHPDTGSPYAPDVAWQGGIAVADEEGAQP